MIELSLLFPHADMQAFRTQMDRLITELGLAPEDAVRLGTIALLKSIRASTRRAPERRKVMVSRSARNRRVNGQRIFKVELYDRSTDSKTTRSIFAGSLAEAKRSPLANIRYAGLARASWGWSMQKLFGSGRPNVKFQEPAGVVSTTKRGRGRSYEIEISNNLDYVSKAFNQGRGPAVSTAMARAASTLRGRIEQRLKGAMR